MERQEKQTYQADPDFIEPAKDVWSMLHGYAEQLGDTVETLISGGIRSRFLDLSTRAAINFIHAYNSYEDAREKLTHLINDNAPLEILISCENFITGERDKLIQFSETLFPDLSDNNFSSQGTIEA